MNFKNGTVKRREVKRVATVDLMRQLDFSEKKIKRLERRLNEQRKLIFVLERVLLDEAVAKALKI